MIHRRFLPFLLGVLATCGYLVAPAPGVTTQFDFTGGDLAATFGPGTLSYLNDTDTVVHFGKATDFTYLDTSGNPQTVATMPDGNPDVMYFEAFAKPTDKTTGSWDGAQAILFDTASAPSSGYNRINQYTFVFDLLVPNIDVTYMALFDCQPDQKDASGLRGDAEFFVKRTSTDPLTAGVGISSNYEGIIHNNEWHRIAVTVDLLIDPSQQAPWASEMRRYVDGVEVSNDPITIGNDSKGGPDMRFSLGRGAGTAGGDGGFNEVPFLFYDLDPETNDGIVSSIFFTDRVLSATEIAALGGPSAQGIFVEEPGLAGDLNNDGVVNSGDLDLVRGNWGTNDPAGDANGDGVVNSGDLDVVRSNWGAQASAAAVPEPAALLLLAGLGLFACLRRSR